MSNKLRPVLRDPNNIPVDVYQSATGHILVVPQDTSQSVAINCRGFRIAGDADMYFSVGASSLGTLGMYLPKKTVEYVPLMADSTFYVSAVGNGTFTLTEFN